MTFAVDLHAATVEQFAGLHEDADAWKKRFDPRRYLTGTIDWVGTVDGEDWVDDLKTGFLKDVNTLAQLKSYALALWLLRGKPKRYRCHRSLTHWRKYPLAGLPERHWGRPVSGLELWAHMDELAFAAENPRLAVPSDEGCRFCEARPTCLEFISNERTKA